MRRLSLLAVAYVILLALVLGGCTSQDASEDSAEATEAAAEAASEAAAAEDAALEAASETAAAEDAAREAAIAQSESEAYARAAQSVDFPVYEPAYLPEGFEYLADESVVEAHRVGIVYGLDDARLLILQGQYDFGDGTETVSEDAMFSDQPAHVLSTTFAWDGPASGEDAEAVYVHIDGSGTDYAASADYSVIGTGITRDELLKVAENMQVVK